MVSALYLHIPFCHARCAYCDFDSRALRGAALDAAADRYLEALLARVDALGDAGALADVRTAYVGGGTPTVLGDRLPELVRRVRAWCSPSELTCEANPESLSAELAAALEEPASALVSAPACAPCAPAPDPSTRLESSGVIDMLWKRFSMYWLSKCSA